MFGRLCKGIFGMSSQPLKTLFRFWKRSSLKDRFSPIFRSFRTVFFFAPNSNFVDRYLSRFSPPEAIALSLVGLTPFTHHFSINSPDNQDNLDRQPHRTQIRGCG